MSWIDDLLAHTMQRRALCRTLKLVRIPTHEGFKPGPRRLWYKGADQYFDVFVDVRDGDVEWMQFTLRGMSLTWDPKKNRLQTDVTNEMGFQAGVSASKLLYGVRADDGKRFTLLVMLMLEQAEDEPLFHDVALQLRKKIDKTPISNQLSA